MKHREELDHAQKVLELLIKGGVVTSVCVRWSEGEGVVVEAGIGRIHSGYKVSRVGPAFLGNPQDRADALVRVLRAAWEKEADQKDLDKDNGR